LQDFNRNCATALNILVIVVNLPVTAA